MDSNVVMFINLKKLNLLSINIFELNFYQEQNKWRHNLLPIEVSKDDSDRVIDLLIYRNHSAPIKNLNVFFGVHHKNFICRQCLNSYRSENMLMLHKPKCENYVVTTVRTSSESHIQWKKNIFIRIHYVLGLMQILKLIMNMIILVYETKQLMFINKTQYLMVIL